MTAKKAPATTNVYDLFDSVDMTEPSDLIGKTLNLDPGKVEKWMTHTQNWVVANVLTIDTAVQLGIVAACLIIGLGLGQLLSTYVFNMVERTQFSPHAKNILHRLHRLTGALFVFILLFLCLIGINAADLPLKSGIIDAALRLTTAWIVIKVAVKIVRNTYMRKFIGGTVMLIVTLSIFGWLDPVSHFLDQLGFSVGTSRISVLTVFRAVFVTVILAYAALGLAALMERQLDNVSALTSGSRLLISKILRMLLIAIAVMLGFTMAGVNLSMLAVFSGAIGLGAGLGLQKGVSNLFTGIMLLLDRTIQPGDIIEMPNGAFGIVRQMGSRCTEITTLDKKSYLIPNEELVSKQVINWSRSGNNLQLNVEFGVGYEQDPREIIALAKAAAAKSKRVLKNPAPSCKMKSFKEGSLEFILIFWIDDAGLGIVNAKSEVLINLWEDLKSHNITIPYTPRTIFQPNPPPPPAEPGEATK
ncbi:MAG: MscS Mechanosensitive ion channel [Micavibrio sp.]|nr:MscS Mechanosensitive ion channel [Micavibrio sp.]